MPISNTPAPCSDEASRPSIFNEQLVQRLRAARGRSDEPLISESVAHVLEADALVAPSLEEMRRMPHEIILKPIAGSSENPPEHAVEMAELEAVYQKIRSVLRGL